MDVMNNDPRFVDGSWFDPLEVGAEYIPDGGHGPTNANFTHSDGRDYDIQYIQIGWSATHTYNRIVAHSLYFSYMMFVAAMQDKDYFKPENIFPNTRGYEMGINGAIKHKSFNDLYDEQCGCDK